MSNSYNPSPLMMGAAAYLVLFLPVVVAARWIETQVRVEAMIQTFFNPEIIAAAWPIVLAGLLNTDPAVAARGAARPARRPDPGAAGHACSTRWCAGR